MTSRDPKGQCRDLKMLRAQYLENGWKYGLGSNRPPIGNGPWDSNGHVSDDVTWPGKVKVVTTVCLGPIISTTAGDTDLVPMEHQYLGIIWSHDRWRHVTLKGQCRDLKMLRAQYLENGWRYGLGANGAPIGNDYFGFKKFTCTMTSCYPGRSTMWPSWYNQPTRPTQPFNLPGSINEYRQYAGVKAWESPLSGGR